MAIKEILENGVSAVNVEANINESIKSAAYKGASIIPAWNDFSHGVQGNWSSLGGSSIQVNADNLQLTATSTGALYGMQLLSPFANVKEGRTYKFRIKARILSGATNDSIYFGLLSSAANRYQLDITNVEEVYEGQILISSFDRIQIGCIDPLSDGYVFEFKELELWDVTDLLVDKDRITVLETQVSDNNDFISSSFQLIESLSNRVTQTNNEPLVSDYTNTAGADIQQSVTHANDAIRFQATCSPAASIPYFHKVGFNIDPVLYSLRPVTIAVIIKGTVKVTNCTSVLMQTADSFSPAVSLVSNPVDNQVYNIELIYYVNYTEGYQGNGKFVFISQLVNNAQQNMTIDYNLSHFAVFEKIDQFADNDYFTNHANSKAILKEIPSNLVTNDILAIEKNRIDELQVRADENDVFLEDSFLRIEHLSNRVTQINIEVAVVNYTLTQGADIQESITHANDVMRVKATCSPAAAIPYRHRLGFDIQPALYAAAAKSVVIIVKGTMKVTNCSSVIISALSNFAPAITIVSNPVDNQVYDVEAIMFLNYPAGYSGNGRYVPIEPIVSDVQQNMTIDYNLTHLAVFEKNDRYTDADYFTNHAIAKAIFKDLPSDIVTSAELEAGLQDVRIFPSAFELNFNADISMLIMYGQSLSVGGINADAFTDYRNMISFPGGPSEWFVDLNPNNAQQVNDFYGNDFVPLGPITTVPKPPVVAAAVAWLQLLEQENKVDFDTFDHQFIFSSPGQVGSPLTTFIKGTIYYQRLILSVQKGYDIARSKGKTFDVPVLFWIQGEADNNFGVASEYATNLSALFNDLNTDIKAITGQSYDVKFVTYQTSPSPTGGSNGGTIGLLNAALTNANIYSAAAMYQFYYSDPLHPGDRAVVGHQLGIIAKRLINEGVEMPVFYPKSHSILNTGVNGEYILNVEFNVPVLPMRFDISGDIYHNLNGKQVNYGFSLIRSSDQANIIAAEPVIKRGKILSIKCSENPTGATLHYAMDGINGGGNLCDSQAIDIDNKGKLYRVDNFCVAFNNYVIS